MIIILWYMYFVYLFHFLTFWFYILDFFKADTKVFQLLLPSDWFYLKFAFQKQLLHIDSMLKSFTIAFSIKQGFLSCLYDIKMDSCGFAETVTWKKKSTKLL